MSRYNRCKECYNMECVFVTGERQDFDTSDCADFRPQTNADRVRYMSIDKLIEWYCRGRPCGSCPYGGVECGIRDWLESTVKGEQEW